MKLVQIILLIISISLATIVQGLFVSTKSQLSKINLSFSRSMRSTSLASSSIVALGEDDLFRQQQFNAQLLEKLARPIDPGPHLRIKGRLLNLWGIMYAVNTIIAVIIMLPFMAVGAIISDMSGRKKQRKIVDWFVHLWANLALTMSFCRPQVYGLENLPKSDEPVMFVPNHTSFVDILVFSGFVPRPFKYLSKAEILKIPLIGWGMQMARHVFLTRGDLKSTIACTELCVERLRDGNAMVLFAEGTRSADGRLQQFKKGAFQIAKAAGVRVVPVSIGNLHRLMPRQAVLPIAPLQHAYIKIHPAIETANRTVTEVRTLCHKAVNEGLPTYQQFQKPVANIDPPSE